MAQIGKTTLHHTVAHIKEISFLIAKLANLA
jgi:hypothetical protein